MQNGSGPSLDVIIPVYNEGHNIVRILEDLARHVTVPFRVLICYDHEQDNTLAVLSSHPDSLVKILLVKNRGQGVHAAVLSGFAASTASAVIVFPADDFYNARIIDGMFQRFQEGYDIVSASRLMEGGCMVGCPWLKGFLVRWAAWSLHALARVPTRDASNGFRLFSRRVLDEIAIESALGFTYSIELLVKCHRLGWRVTEVPAAWMERRNGQSRFRIFRWLPGYLRWYGYAFATTYLRRPLNTVKKKPTCRVIPE